MSIWALSDPHLEFSTSNKSMEVFGPMWADYTNRIQKHWKNLVKENDLMLIPGDISWAMKFDAALIDLNWINNLPGTKIILKGNHDYWWPSASKLKSSLPPSIQFIQNNVYNWNGVSIGGSRLWDSDEYSFNEIIEFQENPHARKIVQDKKLTDKIFLRELERLKLSLKQLDQNAKLRITLTHYPPIGLKLEHSRVSKILEEYNIDYCVFGHLHSIKPNRELFGEKNGVKYILSSSDYLEFVPIKVV